MCFRPGTPLHDDATPPDSSQPAPSLCHHGDEPDEPPQYHCQHGCRGTGPKPPLQNGHLCYKGRFQNRKWRHFVKTNLLFHLNSLDWIFILRWCVFVATGVAGACAGQPLPCPLLRRQQEAGQSPIIPPQQQRVELPGAHRKLLRQDTWVSLLWDIDTKIAVLESPKKGQNQTPNCYISTAIHHNGLSMNQALLGLSPNIAPGPKEGDLAHDMSHEVKRMHADKGTFMFLTFMKITVKIQEHTIPTHNSTFFTHFIFFTYTVPSLFTFHDLALFSVQFCILF